MEDHAAKHYGIGAQGVKPPEAVTFNAAKTQRGKSSESLAVFARNRNRETKGRQLGYLQVQ